MTLADRLDLELAWDKTQSNLRDSSRIFVNDPQIIDIVNRNRDAWIDYLHSELQGEPDIGRLHEVIQNDPEKDTDDLLSEVMPDEGNYSPDSSRTINIPKSGWNVRPGAALTLNDATIYSALVLNMYDDIREEIRWSANEQRFSRLLFDEKTDKGWIEYPGKTWNDWNDKSISLASEHEYVLFTDVAGFFENIERKVLLSNLREFGVDEIVLNTLMSCIKRWSEPRERGLPQGYYPSDILSEVYMNKIDRKLALDGATHTRFSDNLRIFCESQREAKMALKSLTEEYRNIGLNLQREKTEIVPSGDAIERLESPNRTIEYLEDAVSEKVESQREARANQGQSGGSPYDGANGGIDNDSPYTDGGRFNDDPDEIEADEAQLERAFKQEFIDSDCSFNQHLFRFITTRLGILDNNFAVDYCLDRISDGKTESRHILDKYFSRLSDRDAIISGLATMLEEDELLYEFHRFVIIRWLYQEGVTTEQLLEVMRQQIERPDALRETINYSIVYLGEHGESVDLDGLVDLYEEERDWITKALIIYSLKNMESSRRNGIYRQAEGDNVFCEYAVKYTKEIAE